MSVASLQRFGVSPARIVALAAAMSTAVAFLTRVVTGGVLGHATDVVSLAVGGLVFYFVLSAPRRIADGQRLAEARETPLLSASAAACLAVTGSRSRTIVLLRPRDPALKAGLKEAGREVLLGTGVGRALESSAQSMVSYSAAAAFRGLAAFAPSGVEQGDEEARGLAMSSDLNRETKVPILMTVCFFTPIMLILYAVFSHAYGPADFAELASLEFIVLDLVFFLSAAERSRR